MTELIPAVDPQLIQEELTPSRFIRHTNKNENHIYLITHEEAPNVMLEIGRLRELTFREAGGGTGKEVDIDEFDTSGRPYSQ